MGANVDYQFITTAADFDTDLAATDWSDTAKSAVAAAKPLADLTKASAASVDVAVGAEGGWCVVRIAPFNPEP